MKFNCGPTRLEKIRIKEKWHKWFAWYPVRLNSGDCKWLETVWRRGVYFPYSLDFCEWKYKESIKETTSGNRT